MKLIKSSSKIITPTRSIAGMMKHITECGYTCYKTEKEITNDVAAGFVERMIKNIENYDGENWIDRGGNTYEF